jgi:membrane-bound metal-dependent hydrolase YbcI (DUF457 family)
MVHKHLDLYQIRIPIHNIKKIIGSNVLITPSCIHLFDIGLSACVPYELTFIIYVIFPHVDVTHIWMWAQLAVFLHVFVDIFNPNNHSVIPIHNIKKIIGSNVLITPSCIHLFDIGLSSIHSIQLFF